MKIPAISNFNSSSNFLKSFYETNKQADKTISYRSISHDLNWPNSYLHDIITGRKNLTITRAFEFAKFAKLSLQEVERLVYLTLIDSGTEEMKHYFLDKLSKELNFAPASLEDAVHENIHDAFNETTEELKGDICASAILKLFIWSKGKIDKNDISKLLFLFPELADTAILEDKISKLVKNKNIEIIPTTDENIIEVKILNNSIHFIIDKQNAHLGANFTDNMSKILRHKKVSGLFNSGYLIINKKKAKDIRFKINALRNWLLEVETESLNLESENQNESLLFQYDINFAPVIDYKELKINNLHEWETDL